MVIILAALAAGIAYMKDLTSLDDLRAFVNELFGSDFTRTTSEETVWVLTSQYGYGLPDRDEFTTLSIAHPPDWRFVDGQFWDASNNKVAELSPGPFRFETGSCLIPPPDPFDEGQTARTPFQLGSTSGAYERTSTYCEGDGQTYSGPCVSHLYCIDPNASGYALALMFLEFGDTPSAAMERTMQHIVASVQMTPAN